MKFKEITSIFRTKAGIAYYTNKFDKNGPVAFIINEKEKVDEFLSWYKSFLSKNKNPDDRVIEGIEDVNKDGVYCEETFQKSRKLCMTISERLKDSELTPNITKFLWSLVEFGIAARYAREIMKTSMARVGESLKEASEDLKKQDKINLDAMGEIMRSAQKTVRCVTEYNVGLDKMLIDWLE